MDADLGDRWPPYINGWSAFLWMAPLLLILPPLVYFDPPAQTRHWIVGAAAVPSAFMFGVWAWRLFLAYRRGVRRMRDTH
jgi:hypothetical protein